MPTEREKEKGWKWWVEKVIVPLIGSGGVVAIIVALLARSPAPPPTGTPTSVPLPTFTKTPTVDVTEASLIPSQSPTLAAAAATIPFRTVGGLLYREDFEDADAIDAWTFNGAEWAVIDDGTGNHVLENVEFGGWSFAWAGDGEWQDYLLEARCRIRTAPPLGETAGCGLMVRFDEQFWVEDECAFYGAQVEVEAVGIVLGGCSPSWEVLSWSSYLLPAQDEWHTLEFRVYRDSLEILSDGQLLKRVFDDRLSQGQIGLYVAPETTVWWDDVLVIKLVP